ncbi:hypothetical protein ACF0H5_018942 [Mactra antiquata]
MDRKTAVFTAKMAEQTERFDEMANYMKFVASQDQELSTEERNLLSVAYKNVVGARRSSWRVMSSIEVKETGDQEVEIAKEYRNRVEKELIDLCNEVIALLDDKLIEKASQPEGKVFFYKMKGDYYRYLAEVSSGKEEVVNKSKEAYEAATTEAETNLPATHPTRLGLALNYSVFHYEIVNDATQACNIAKKAFDMALADFENAQDEAYKDSTLIMQLLRDNLTLWTSEAEQDADGDGQ